MEFCSIKQTHTHRKPPVERNPWRAPNSYDWQHTQALQKKALHDKVRCIYRGPVETPSSYSLFPRIRWILPVRICLADFKARWVLLVRIFVENFKSKTELPMHALFHTAHIRGRLRGPRLLEPPRPPQLNEAAGRRENPVHGPVRKNAWHLVATATRPAVLKGHDTQASNYWPAPIYRIECLQR